MWSSRRRSVATTAQRDHLQAAMHFLLAHTALIHYAQVRPMRTAHLYEQQAATLFRQGHGLTMDCSESCTLLCRWAGLQDPNGLGYDGSGFTGTMLGHLTHYTDPEGAGVGALCVYGPGSGEHVAMVLKPGPDPLMFSHGSESGPLTVRWSVEKVAHKPPATFLDVSAL